MVRGEDGSFAGARGARRQIRGRARGSKEEPSERARGRPSRHGLLVSMFPEAHRALAPAASAIRPADGRNMIGRREHGCIESWVAKLEGREVGSIAMCVVVGRLADPVALVLEQARGGPEKRRVTQAEILLPVAFWENGHARRTMVANAVGHAGDAGRAASCDVIEPTISCHSAFIGPK